MGREVGLYEFKPEVFQLTRIRVAADFPIVVYDADGMFNFLVPATFFEKTLHSHFGIGFLHSLLIDRSRIQDKWDTLSTQLGVVVNKFFEFDATHAG